MQLSKYIPVFLLIIHAWVFCLIAVSASILTVVGAWIVLSLMPFWLGVWHNSEIERDRN